jgi:hypothetical protein
MQCFSNFCKLSFWQQLLNNDFNRGYAAGIALVVGVILLLLVIKFLIWCIFRTRRCASISISGEMGDVIVSRHAVVALLNEELKKFDQLSIRTIKIMRRGSSYMLRLYGVFYRGNSGLIELLDQVKPALIDSLKSTFGIKNISSIGIIVEECRQNKISKDGDSDKIDPDVSTVIQMPPVC